LLRLWIADLVTFRPLAKLGECLQHLGIGEVGIAAAGVGQNEDVCSMDSHFTQAKNLLLFAGT